MAVISMLPSANDPLRPRGHREFFIDSFFLVYLYRTNSTTYLGVVEPYVTREGTANGQSVVPHEECGRQ